jgi:hypothetical protein
VVIVDVALRQLDDSVAQIKFLGLTPEIREQNRNDFGPP